MAFRRVKGCASWRRTGTWAVVAPLPVSLSSAASARNTRTLRSQPRASELCALARVHCHTRVDMRTVTHPRPTHQSRQPRCAEPALRRWSRSTPLRPARSGYGESRGGWACTRSCRCCTLWGAMTRRHRGFPLLPSHAYAANGSTAVLATATCPRLQQSRRTRVLVLWAHQIPTRSRGR